MRRGKVAVFSPNGIEITFETCPRPQPDELVTRMVVAGICGSDVHRVAGDIAPTATPICFGHEAVGKILEIGESIKEDRLGNAISVGDMVYWCPSTPCGTCRECASRNPILCSQLNWPVPAGGPNAAGFREYATLSNRCIFVRLPVNVSPLAVIAFGCAMPTAIRGFSKINSICAETDIVIQGSGPVGLACTLLASLSHARSITVIGDPQQRLQAATTLGATQVISLSRTTEEERADFIRKVTGGRGAAVLIEAAGAPNAFTEGLHLLGMNGQYLILGLYSGSARCAIDPVRLNNLNQQIIGSLGLDLADYHQTVRIASMYGESRRLADLVTHKFNLDNLEEAIATVSKGISVKAIVTP